MALPSDGGNSTTGGDVWVASHAWETPGRGCPIGRATPGEKVRLEILGATIITVPVSVCQTGRMDDPVIPERPRDANVAEEVPDSTSAIEGARLLGNEARPRLRADGFTDRQIDEWAESFMTEVGSGEVDDLVAWISEQEGRAGGVA